MSEKKFMALCVPIKIDLLLVQCDEFSIRIPMMSAVYLISIFIVLSFMLLPKSRCFVFTRKFSKGLSNPNILLHFQQLSLLLMVRTKTGKPFRCFVCRVKTFSNSNCCVQCSHEKKTRKHERLEH